MQEIIDSIRLEKVRPDQLAALKELSTTVFIESFGPVNTVENMRKYLHVAFADDKLLSEINNPDSTFYFACTNQRPVGYFKINSGKAQTELHDGNSLEIERIYVLRELQGKKIGQFLFDNILQIAAERAFTYIWLGVWDKNFGAIKFYERNGFKQFGSHPFWLGDEEQVDIMMKLDLTSPNHLNL